MDVQPAKLLNLPPERWQEAKALRLEALRLEGAAFASQYEDELAFADEIWRTRLDTAYSQEYNMTVYAELAGELIGMVGAQWQSREKLRHLASVYSMYVSPGWRRQGIARQLMRRLLDDLSALPQIEKVSLTVNAEILPAIRLYESLGFAQAGRARRELKVAGRYYDLLYMEKLIR